MPLQLFYSYSHQDEPLRDELDTHLALLRRRGVIATWHDRRIAASEDWRAAIDEHLERANLILLLVSPDFLASDYCYDVEMRRAMERHRHHEAAVVPVIARPVDLEGAPFAEVQALPKDAKPVTTWANRDEAWTDVAKGVRKLAEALASAGAPSLSGAPAAPASVEEKLARIRPPERELGHEVEPPVDEYLGAPVPRRPSVDERVAAAPSTSASEHDMDEARTQPLQRPPLPPGMTPERRAEIALERALAGFQEEMVEAMRSRTPGEALRPSESWRMAEHLAAIPQWKRILWVDDRPENNRFEIAALNRLQLEVKTACSTEEALALLRAPTGCFDLVISDWSRPTLRSLVGAAEGLRLLREMRAERILVPLVVYHGHLSPVELARRREQVRDAGGQGATFRPNELFELVTRLLSG
jgi:CheY-like chemotaxis protein